MPFTARDILFGGGYAPEDEEKVSTTPSVVEPPPRQPIVQPQPIRQQEPKTSSAYNILFGSESVEEEYELPSFEEETEATTSYEIEPTEVTPLSDVDVYGGELLPTGKIAAGAHRFLGTAKKAIAPAMRKTAFLHKKPEERTAEAKRLEEEVPIHGKAAEILDPTWYRSEKINEKIEKIRGQDPNIANAFKMGDISGAADINVTNAFLSGDETAKNIALNTAQMARETGGEFAEKREQRTGITGKATNVLESVSEMLPMMGKSAALNAIPGVGQAMSASMWAMQGTGDIITQLKDEGVDDDTALAYGLIGGMAYSLVEQVQIGRITNVGKKVVGESVRKKLINLAKEKGLDWLQNVREEVIQGIVTENAILDAMKASGIEVDRKEVHDRYTTAIKENFTGSAWPMAVLSLAGLGAGAGRIGYRAGAEKKTTGVSKATEELFGAEKQPTEAVVVPKPEEGIQLPSEAEVAPETVKTVPTVEENTLESLGVENEAAFYSLPEEQQNEIYRQLSDNERDRVLDYEEQEKITVEGVREKVEKEEGYADTYGKRAQKRGGQEKGLEQRKEDEIRLRDYEKKGRMETRERKEIEREVPSEQQPTTGKERVAETASGAERAVAEGEIPEAGKESEIRKSVESVKREDKQEKKEISNVDLVPSEAQKEAGNYRKAHIRRDGFDISIENAAGSKRFKGNEWEVKINHDYGYIRGTKGADAFRTKGGTDQVDTFIKPNSEEGGTVYIVNQVDPSSGKFDEHKVMMGFDSKEEARKAYLSNYEKGWKGLGSIYEIPMDEFKQWVFTEETKYPYKGKVEYKKPAEEMPVTDGMRKRAKLLASKIPGVKVSGKGIGGGTKRGGKVETEHLMWFDDEVSQSTKAIKVSEGIKELRKTINEARKGVKDEKETRPGVVRPDEAPERKGAVKGKVARTKGEKPKAVWTRDKFSEEDESRLESETPESLDDIEFDEQDETDYNEARALMSMYGEMEEKKFKLDQAQKIYDIIKRDIFGKIDAKSFGREGDPSFILENKRLFARTGGKNVDRARMEFISKNRDTLSEFGIDEGELDTPSDFVEFLRDVSTRKEISRLKNEIKEGERELDEYKPEPKPKKKEKELKPFGWKQQDIFGKEKTVEQLEKEETKRQEKAEIKRRMEGTTGGEADIRGLPMFEDQDIEGSQQTIKFAKRKEKEVKVSPEQENGIREIVQNIEGVDLKQAKKLTSMFGELVNKVISEPGKARESAAKVIEEETEEVFKKEDVASGINVVQHVRKPYIEGETEHIVKEEEMPEVKPSISISKRKKRDYDTKKEEYGSPKEKRLVEAVYESQGQTPAPGTIRYAKMGDVQETLANVISNISKEPVNFIQTNQEALNRDLGFSVDGFRLSGEKYGDLGGIYIDVESERPVLWTAMHETVHALPAAQKKRLYDAMKLTDAGLAKKLEEGEEFLADVAGEMMSRQDFWENLEKQSPKTLKTVVNKLIEILNKVAKEIRALIASDSENSAEYEDYLLDVDGFRNELVEVVKDYTKGDLRDVSERMAAAVRKKGVGIQFAKREGRLRRIPKTVPIPSQEQIREAKELVEADREHVKRFEKESRSLRRRLTGLQEDLLQDRAQIGLLLETTKAAQVWKLKNAIYDYAKKIGLSGVPYNKVSLMIKNTDTARGLKKAVEKLDDVWLGYERRAAYTEVLDKVEAEYRRLKKIQSGKSKSTVAAEYNNRLKEYLDSLKTQPEWFKGMDYYDMVDKMVSYYNQYSAKDIKKATGVVDLPQDIANWMHNPEGPVPDNLKRLIQAMFQRSLSTMTTEQLRGVVDNIKSIKETGRTVLEMRDMAKKEELDKTVDEISMRIKESTTKKAKPLFIQAVDSKRKSKHEYLGKLAEEAGWSFIDPERMAEWLVAWKKDDYENLKEMIHYKLYDAETKKTVGTEKAAETFNLIHEKVDWIDAIKKKHTEINLKSIYEKNGVGFKGDKKSEKRSLTLNQMMFIYANSKNPGNYAHFKGLFNVLKADQGTGQYVVDFEATEKIADDVLDVITKKLPEDYKEAVDNMIKYYDEQQWARMSEVFERSMQIEMPKENNYFPIQNIKTDRAESAIVADQMARSSYKIAGVQKGFTKMRIHSNAPFKEMDYFNTVATNLQQVEHYIAYNDAIREVQQFLNRPEIKKSIEGKSEEVYRQLNDWVRAVAHGRTFVSDDWVSKSFDFVRRNFVTFALGLKATTGMQQVSSMAKGLSMVNKAEAARASAGFLLHPIKAEKFADGKSVLMRNRIKSYERELAEIAEKSVMKNFAKQKIPLDLKNSYRWIKQNVNLRDIMMWHIGKIDKSVCVILWNGKYYEMKGNGATEQEAIRAADEVIRKTQSRGGVLYMPKIYRTGGLVKAFTIFTSDLNQNINLALEMKGKFGLQSTPKNMHDMFWNILIATMCVWLVNNAYQPVVSAIKRARGDDEPQDWRGEEFIRELVSQYTGNIPFFGDLIEAGVALGVNEAKEARGIIPDKRLDKYIGEFIPAGIESLERIIQGVKGGRPYDLLEGLLVGLGVPTGNIMRGKRGIEKIKKKGAGSWRHLFWSDRQLREETIYNSMARRLYDPRPKSDDSERYREWYVGLDNIERADFAEYAKKWYMENEIKKQPH